MYTSRMLRLDDPAQIKGMPVEERRKYYLTPALRAKIPVEECGEPVVNLEEFFRDAGVPIVIASVWKPEELKMTGLRRGAAERLLQAARAAAPLRLKVTDALRPLRLQRELFDKVMREIKEKEPSLEGDALRARTTRFVADPSGFPPHSTGGALDLTLVDESGEEIDMGTSVDALDDRAETFHPGIAPVQAANRAKLREAMEAAGFVNLASEWWHYSCGDQYWAAFFEKSAAIYGSIE